MSYPGISGYGGYYNSNVPNSQHGYGSTGGRQPSASPAYPDVPTYQNDTRTAQQYPPQEHNWPGQNQHGYPSESEQRFGTDAFRGSHGQPPAYYEYQSDYTRQSNTYLPQQPSTSAAQTYHSPSLATSKPASTQGLSNLVYASGLESAGMHNRSSSRTSNATGQSSTASHVPSQNTGNRENRIGSPQHITAAQSQSKPQRQSFTSQNELQNASQQRLAVTAVQALAGAVSRRQQNQQNQQNQTNQQQQTSPTMGNTTSQPAQDLERPRAQYVTGDHSQHSRQHAAQTSPSVARAILAPSHQVRPSSRLSDVTQASINISNLVTSDESPNQASTTPRPEAAINEMSNYVDPSKVFNPYHREHERRKREIAEAEAEAKRGAAKEAEGIKTNPATSKEYFESTMAPVSGTQTTAGVTVSNHLTESAQQLTASDEDIDMAEQMKTMMEKMRKLKDKDPKMFTKLWEDMRKSTATSAANTAQTASPKIPAAHPSTTPVISTATPKTSVSQATVVQTPVQMKRSTTPSTKPGSLQPQVALSPPGNGYHVVVEDNQEELPDIGRFPAERRVRTSYKKRQSTEPTSVSCPQPNLPPTAVAGGMAAPSVARSHTASAAQPSTVPVSSGATIWPEAKRNSLADAAVKALNSNPQNLAIGITTDHIHAMLEQNPSYLDLCQLLENKGLKLHRGQFARSLLSNVPDLTSTGPAKGLSQSPTRASFPAINGSQRILSPPVYASQSIVDGSHPAHPMHGQAQPPIPPHPMHGQAQPPITNNIKAESKKVPAFVAYHGSTPSQPPPTAPKQTKPRFEMHNEPKPGTKEAMARKRDFSELVDLTELSDSENYVMSRKEARIESTSPDPDPIAAYELQSQPVPTQAPVQSQSFGALQSSGLSLVPSQMTYSSNQFPRTEKPLQASSTQRPRAILAKSINKSEALRKSYYDPKTVARDILIAAGRHPSERPLNSHLARLLGVHIELDSDLSTFDWDAVDPGGPKAPKVEVIDIPAGPPRFKLGDRSAHSRRAERTILDQDRVERTLKKMAEGATRAGDVAKAGMPPAALVSRFSAQTRQLLHDSLRPSRELEKLPSRLRLSHAVDEDDAQSNRNVTPQKRKASSQISIDISPTSHPQPRSTRSVSDHAPDTMQAQTQPTVKRRGRPVGSKNKHPSINALKTDSKPRAVISAAARATSPPKFTEYKCRWRVCSSQLHNLETLRRHVAKVHKPQKDSTGKVQHICWWKNCDYHQPDGKGNIQPTKVFDSDADWMDHIEDAHLHPLGRKYGDGPATAHIGKPDLDFNVSRFLYHPSVMPCTRTVSYPDPQTIAQDKARYLSDEQGRTTTAAAAKLISDAHPADALTLTSVLSEDFMHIKSYEAAHSKIRLGDKKDKVGIRKASEDFLRAMEVRKEKIGPGIDRGGCTLVNDARRATLVQNANIARVVDYDY